MASLAASMTAIGGSRGGVSKQQQRLPRRVVDEAQRMTDKEVEEYLQREHCVRLWIERTLNITLAADLHAALSNGIVLCYLAQEIDLSSIPLIQEATTSPMRLRENVAFFIAAMEDMGVPKTILFREPDLIDNECMPRVIYTLESYAKLASNKQQLKVPFPTVEQEPAMRAKVSGLVKTMDKKGLEELKLGIAVGKPIIAVNKAGSMKVSPAVIRAQLQLYAGGENKVKLDRIERGFTKVQAMWRGHQVRKELKRRVREGAYRQRVAKELLQTEKDYLENLQKCVVVFKNKMEKAAVAKTAPVTLEDVAAIFSDIEIICNFHVKLRDELAPIVEKWNNHSCLAKSFNYMIGFLPLYSNYVCNYDTSLMKISTLSKKEKFEQLLYSCKLDPDNTKHYDISGFLIQPIQRVPRYALLLNDLCKHTWKDHPDYQGLREAVVKVSKLAAMLNEKKREGESNSAMHRIDSVMTGKPRDFELIIPSRKLLREIKAKVHGKKECTIVLFTDILMLLKGHEKLTYKLSFMLNEGQLKLADDGSGAMEIDHFGNKKGKVVDIRTAVPELAAEFVNAYVVALADLKVKLKSRSEYVEKLESKSPSSSSTSTSTQQQQQQEQQQPTAESLLRERKMKQQTMKRLSGAAGGVNEAKVEDLVAKLEMVRQQIAAVTETIAAAEKDKKRKDKETVSRAKTVLSSLKEEEKEKEAEIASIKAMLAEQQQQQQSSPTASPSMSRAMAHRSSTPGGITTHQILSQQSSSSQQPNKRNTVMIMKSTPSPTSILSPVPLKGNTVAARMSQQGMMTAHSPSLSSPVSPLTTTATPKTITPQMAATPQALSTQPTSSSSTTPAIGSPQLTPNTTPPPTTTHKIPTTPLPPPPASSASKHPTPPPAPTTAPPSAPSSSSSNVMRGHQSPTFMKLQAVLGDDK